MSYQSILVHVDDGERVATRLGAAARLARSFDAELIGAYAVPTSAMSPSLSAVLPDTMVQQRLAEMGEAQEAAEALFRAAATRARLGAAEWRAPAGDAIDALVEHARCTDLVIVGQPEADGDGKAFSASVVDALVLQSGRPVLSVPSEAAPTPIGNTVLVAWNDTREATRAIADAMPLLARAERVCLLSIDTDEADERAPAELQREQRALAWLRLHGLDAELRHVRDRTSDVAEMILAQCTEAGADLIVMGGYGHSPLQERVLGGVTRRLLEAAGIPLLLSH